MNLYCHSPVNFGGANRLVFEDGEPNGQEAAGARIEFGLERHGDREEITPETTKMKGVDITAALSASLDRLEDIDRAQALSNGFNRLDPAIRQDAEQWGIEITDIIKTFNICYAASRGDISATEELLRRETGTDIAHERQRGREVLLTLGQNFMRYYFRVHPGEITLESNVSDNDFHGSSLADYPQYPGVREAAARYIGLPPKSPGDNWNYRWSEIRRAMDGALGER